MPALKDEVKMFITQALACYDSPTYVAEQLAEEYDLILESNQIRRYDPTKGAGKDLGKKYKDIFEATRKAFLEDIDKIPIASRSFRLRSLQRSYDFFVSKKNFIAANQVLEQAAKEVGDAYTNKISLGNTNGMPFLTELQGFNGGSLPIVDKVEDIEGEFIEVKEEVKAKKPKDDYIRNQGKRAPKAPIKADWSEK
jgi:hypothetical protein